MGLSETVKVDLLFMWPEEAMRWLQGTAPVFRLSSETGEVTATETLTEVWQREVLPIMIEGAELWPVHVRKEELFWPGLSWTMSRAFQGELNFACDGTCLPALGPGIGGKKTGPFMIPLFDQLNHSCWPDMR